MLVSAFTTRGLSAEVFRLILAEHELLTGDVVLEELDRVLVEKFRVPRGLLRELIGLLRHHHVQPAPDTEEDYGLRDPADARVLASAQAARADVLVTGDRDLLEVQDRIDRPRILDPRGFWELHRQSRPSG